jgi:membrane dipeptidase
MIHGVHRSKTSAEAGRRARRLLEQTLVWDNHGCMPLRPHDTAFLPQLMRYAKAGVDVVSLNVGFDAVAWENTPQMLAMFRHWIRSHPGRYRLVETVADIRRARRERRLGVFFDIEGGGALNGRLEMVELYRDLGVRWMLIAYNRNNQLGGGCMDVDRGLTRFGRQVVTEMERVGMTVCCSHTGYRTTMDVMRHATRPVIFSHSNPLGVWRHRRNIRDEAIRACAGTGGVVGINGIGIFLGANDNRPETVVEHIDYVAQLVGPRHVGLGLDFEFDMAEAEEYVKAHPEMFPPKEGFANGMRIVPPESLAAIAAGLLARGYRKADLRAILGGNFLRVAQATWPKRRG